MKRIKFIHQKCHINPLIAFEFDARNDIVLDRESRELCEVGLKVVVDVVILRHRFVLTLNLGKLRKI